MENYKVDVEMENLFSEEVVDRCIEKIFTKPVKISAVNSQLKEEYDVK